MTRNPYRDALRAVVVLLAGQALALGALLFVYVPFVFLPYLQKEISPDREVAYLNVFSLLSAVLGVGVLLGHRVLHRRLRASADSPEKGRGPLVVVIVTQCLLLLTQTAFPPGLLLVALTLGAAVVCLRRGRERPRPAP